MKIFVCYRREDSLDFTGRLSDRLAAHFGAGSVFVDVDAIPVGTDFAGVLMQEIRQCDFVLAVIGSRWLEPSLDGSRRLDSPTDFVRFEIESAFALGIPVIPVLVGEAKMPRLDELPGSLAELSFRNALVVSPGPEFHHDLDRLIRALQAVRERVPPTSTKSAQPIPDIDPGELQSNLVFVSHSSLDRQWVEDEIVGLLGQNGIETWYARSAILTSAQWEREILRGMEKCDWFLLIISPRAADSEWVKDELFWAMHHRPTRIVPVIMEPCDLWRFHIRLPRIQHVDFTADIQRARVLLIQSLKRESVADTAKQ